MRIEYTALRNLATGHVVETPYEIVVLGENIQPDFKFPQARNISLDRTRVEVEVYGEEQLIDVGTDLIAIGQATENFEEFLFSTMYGESFTFDGASDTAATAVDPLTVMMESVGFTRERPIPGYYQYKFTVRVL